MIKTGRLPAAKVGGRWTLDRDDLPLTETQRQALQTRAADLEQVVQDALGPHLRPRGVKSYTVRDMVTFQRCLEASRRARSLAGAEHPASVALTEALVALTRGCHVFHRRDKQGAFAQARAAVARALALLYLEGGEECEALARGLEADVLPGIAGLLRRSERRVAV